MAERNLLIRASAGTGKTFALATRYMRLMLLDKVDPGRIVALTFSRAAAQEIYTKILERLWEAAESEENAAAETQTLLTGLKIQVSWNRATFAAQLRRLLEAQHLGTIATLDSFILRMVRNFPLEMGFQHAVEVLDLPGENEAIEQAIRGILSETGRAETFVKTFLATQEGQLPRVLQSRIVSILKSWRKFYAQHLGQTWTVESMCKALGVPKTSACPDFSGLPFCQIARANTLSPEETFVNRCRTYDGSEEIFAASDTVKKLMLHFLHNPEAEAYEYDYYKKHYVFACGREGAEKIRAGLRHMFNVYVLRCLNRIKAQLDLVALVEEAYDRSCRRKGKLTFSDFTRYSAAKEGSTSALALENLEYRFDEKFDHWALDEFQDTSEIQWTCLRDLVEAAAQPASGRTVMAVGDLKQSIYTWRGGNDAPFKELMSWGAFTDEEYGRIEDNDTSYRYEGNTCDFVNAVLGEANLRRGGVIPEARAAAIDRWLDKDCWREHRPVFVNGRPKADDFIRILRVRDPEKKADMASLLSALGEEVAHVWKAHEEAESTESIGILVRRNEDGTKVAEYLRGMGIPVVWEGLNAVSDVPVVNALVDLLRLAEHPTDSFAWTTVSRLFPVCEILFAPQLGDDLSAEKISREVAQRLSHQGLSRTLQVFCKALSAPSAGLDALSKVRLREMVRVAVAYEQRSASRFSIDGFEVFLQASAKRETGASSKVIRILTVHRSKGLTIDRVFVPLVESERDGITNPKSSSPLYGKDGSWALPYLSAETAALNPMTAQAWNEMADERLLAEIRTYYVALTRARKALYVLVPSREPDAAKPHFRDLIASACKDFAEVEASGSCETALEKGREPPFTKKDVLADNAAKWSLEKAAVPVMRRTPSSSGSDGLMLTRRRAVDLFSESFGSAVKRGVEEHARYEAIEWASGEDLEQLPAAFRVAFAKPGPDAEVWRERRYETYQESGGKGAWESGQFDRVVFSGSGASRMAVIYDIKTNAMGRDESVATFEARMRAQYAPQMAAYRDALQKLTGLPQNRVRTMLLLQASGTVVACDTTKV